MSVAHPDPAIARAAFDEALARLNAMTQTYRDRAAAAQVEYHALGEQDRLIRADGIEYRLVCFFERWIGKWVWHTHRIDGDALLEAGVCASQDVGFEKAEFRARAAPLDEEIRALNHQMSAALEVLLSVDECSE